MQYIPIILLLLFASCNANTKKTEEEIVKTRITEDEIIVETIIVEVQNFDHQIITTGKLYAIEKADLRFKTSETIKQIYFRNGNTVGKGQTIAILENSIQKNELLQSKNFLDKAFIERRKLLIENDIDSLNADSVKIKNINIRSGYNEAVNQVEKYKIAYSQTILKAPFDGVIANLDKKQYNYISTSEVFCTLINKSVFEAEFMILESEIANISLNQSVTIIPYGIDSVKLSGYLTQINPIVDNNGMIKIKAKVTNTKNILIEGMNIKVFINKTKYNQLVIPKKALIIRSGKELVFTYENGLAKWNYIETLAENSNSFLLRKGIKIGDTLIISNNTNLVHDSFVKLSNKK